MDEAHSLGVVGRTGRGTEEAFGLQGKVDILSGTFSKSLASIGGWIAGPASVIDRMRFHSRSILFSAAISPASLGAAAKALEILASEPERVVALQNNAQSWHNSLIRAGIPIGTPAGPIVPVQVGDDLLCLKTARWLLDHDVYVNAVLPPSVPRGSALLRSCVTAVHEAAQLELAADQIAKALHEMGLTFSKTREASRCSAVGSR
jgi:7-keto-8-aminopelargonate synthetase-like enzyme